VHSVLTHPHLQSLWNPALTSCNLHQRLSDDLSLVDVIKDGQQVRLLCYTSPIEQDAFFCVQTSLDADTVYVSVTQVKKVNDFFSRLHQVSRQHNP